MLLTLKINYSESKSLKVDLIHVEMKRQLWELTKVKILQN